MQTAHHCGRCGQQIDHRENRSSHKREWGNVVKYKYIERSASDVDPKRNADIDPKWATSERSAVVECMFPDIEICFHSAKIVSSYYDKCSDSARELQLKPSKNAKKCCEGLQIVKNVLLLHLQTLQNGVVVQLVRMPACHAGGREFESRPYRKIPEILLNLGDFDFMCVGF